MVSLTRRTMMSTSLAGVAGTLLAKAPRAARADVGGAPAQRHPCPFYRSKLGSAALTIVSDGTLAFPTHDLWPEVPESERESFLSELYQPSDETPLQVNAMVIDLNGRRVLIDAGNGASKFQPTVGALSENLQAAGIDPASIDTVVFTHLHPDHLWGVTDADNETLTFPNAEYVVSEPELAFWGDPDLPGQMPDGFMRTLTEATLAHLAKIRERLRTVAPTAEARPGVTFVPTHGHTPGHVSIMLESDGETLFSAGDVIPNAFVSLEQPDWEFGFDANPEQGIASRRSFLDQASADRLRVFGYHLPWPGFGHVARHGGAYRWIKEEWSW